MKAFIKHSIQLTLLVILILGIGLFIIPDNAVKSSILGAYPVKHELLKNHTSNSIIFLGGSNLSFGLDSKQLETALHKPIINMGIHAGVGLEFMINDIKPYIKKGDHIILVPEYEHFYTDNFYGEMELVSVLFDVEPQDKSSIDPQQWRHLAKYLPTYAAKKIKNYIPSLFKKEQNEINIYHKNSFNAYGDAYFHWDLPNQPYQSAKTNTGKEEVNKEVISQLVAFNSFIKTKGAQLIILPPVIDSTSYNHQKQIIAKICKSLADHQLEFAVQPAAYAYANSYFFNSYYHLNKSGVDKRSQQLINDLVFLKGE